MPRVDIPPCASTVVFLRRKQLTRPNGREGFRALWPPRRINGLARVATAGKGAGAYPSLGWGIWNLDGCGVGEFLLAPGGAGSIRVASAWMAPQLISRLRRAPPGSPELYDSGCADRGRSYPLRG